MGMYLNKNGQMDFRRGAEANGKSYTSPSIVRKAAEILQDVGDTAIKASTVTTVGVTTGAAIYAAGIPVGGALLGAGLTTIATSELLKGDDEEAIETTPLENALGGKSYQEVMHSIVSTEDESAKIANQTITDPFEAFKQCMGDAGMSHAAEINSNTGCVPQSAARNQTRDLSLN